MANQNQGAAAPPSVEDLNKRGASFIGKLESQERRMVAIAREFDRIAAKVKVVIDATDPAVKAGTVTAVVGVGVTLAGLAAALFTGGGSLVAAVGAVTAVVGGTVATSAKVVQFLQESCNDRDLERLGNKFLGIAQPLSEELREIKALMRQLQVGGGGTSYLVDEYDLRRVDEASGAIEEAVEFINRLVQLIQKLLQRLTTNEEKDELTRMIVKSGEQCWKIINRFRDIKADLHRFNA